MRRRPCRLAAIYAIIRYDPPPAFLANLSAKVTLNCRQFVVNIREIAETSKGVAGLRELSVFPRYSYKWTLAVMVLRYVTAFTGRGRFFESYHVTYKKLGSWSYTKYVRNIRLILYLMQPFRPSCAFIKQNREKTVTLWNNGRGVTESQLVKTTTKQQIDIRLTLLKKLPQRVSNYYDLQKTCTRPNGTRGPCKSTIFS